MMIFQKSRAGVGVLAKSLIALLVVLGATAETLAQNGGTPSHIIASDKRLQRWKQFNDERAFPFARVPAGAHQTAVADYDSKWGMGQRAQPMQGAGTPAAAITADSWTSIGPTPIGTTPTNSGRVNSVAVHPSNGNIIYIGAAAGGVWKTTDGGTNWTALTDSQCSLAMGSVVIDPVNPNIVYAGTGEQNFALDSYYGCGVLRSTDGGSSWTQLGGSIFSTTTGGATISRLLIDPSTAGSATATKIYAATSFGLYVSTNSGTSWTQTLASTPVTDLVLDPSNTSNLYAAVGNIFGSTNNGVYKSTNGGTSWTKLAGGLPTASHGRINIAIAANTPSTLFASVQNTSTYALLGIWKTTDSGATWTQLSATGASCASQCWYDMGINVNPTNANNIFFSGFSIYRSTDGGATFTDVGGSVHVDHHGFGFQPGNPAIAYATSDGGVWKTTDGGSTWASANGNLSITQFQAGIAVHPTDANTVMGGTQDNGTLTTSGALAWTLLLGGDGGYSAIDQTTPTTRYAETQWGSSSYSGPRRSDTGAAGTYIMKNSGISFADRAQFYPPLVMSPSNSQTLYFGTYRIYRTTNKAETWTAISGDLTLGGTITAIAQAKSNSQVIYAGTNDGRVQVTTDGGASWTLATTGLPSRVIKALAVHPTDPNTAYVTVSGFGTAHVFKTTNGGAAWTSISSNLPNMPVNAIALDPGEPILNLFIGTDLGVFRTTDGGASWSAFNTGMPNTPVFDIAYNQATNTLIAATHGRGMFKGTISGVPAAITSPASGSTLTAASQLFQWNSGTNVSQYWLYAGSAVGSSNYYDSGALTSGTLSKTATGLPADGSTVYVRLFSQIGGAWQSRDYTYTAAVAAKAVMSTPAPGSTLAGASVTFNWTTGTAATEYFLTVGTTVGGGDIYNLSTALNTSATVSSIPVTGVPIYVVLWTKIGTNWSSNAYTYTAANTVAKAVLISPAPNSTLTSGSPTFTWSAAAGATQYWLSIGSTFAGSDFFNQSVVGTSQAVTGLPVNGSTVYVRLWTQTSGQWFSNDYTLTAASGVKAAMTSPVAGSTLSGASVAFAWNTGVAASEYWLSVGTTVGGGELYNASTATNTTVTVGALPLTGVPVYVRLWTKLGVSWLSNDYTYSAFLNGSKAVLTSPAPSSTLTSTAATFTWNAGTNATQYWLTLGSTVGGGDIFNQSAAGTSQTVTGLPSNGSTVYVQLWTQVAGVWLRNDYTLTAVTGTNGAMSSPAPGSTLTGSSVAFSWNAGVGASEYWLTVGTTVGGGDIYNLSTGTNQTVTVGSLPASGGPVYVRLWTKLGATWSSSDYTYTAVTGSLAVLTTPAPGSTLAGSSVAFSWNAGVGASEYWLTVGTTVGGGDIYNLSTGTNQTATVATLPLTGVPIYVQLWTKLGTAWSSNSYTYTAKTGPAAALGNE